jgi:hypothetical protein
MNMGAILPFGRGIGDENQVESVVINDEEQEQADTAQQMQPIPQQIEDPGLRELVSKIDAKENVAPTLLQQLIVADKRLKDVIKVLLDDPDIPYDRVQGWFSSYPETHKRLQTLIHKMQSTEDPEATAAQIIANAKIEGEELLDVLGETADEHKTITKAKVASKAISTKPKIQIDWATWGGVGALTVLGVGAVIYAYKQK